MLEGCACVLTPKWQVALHRHWCRRDEWLGLDKSELGVNSKVSFYPDETNRPISNFRGLPFNSHSSEIT